MLYNDVFKWVMFFYVYCMFGWIFESLFLTIKKRKFVNRGFLYGPVIPIYGEGAIIMLAITSSINEKPWLVFIIGMIGATILELIVGIIMESIFKVKYWNYSNNKIQFRGYICLSSSICWGIFTVLLIELVHRYVDGIITNIDNMILIIIVILITLLFVIDIIISTKEAWNLRNILIAITKAKEELIELEKKLINKKEEIHSQIESKKEKIEKNVHNIKSNIADVVDIDFDTLHKLINESKSRYFVLTNKLNVSKKLLFKRNPGATSKRFYDTLENVKASIESKRKK